MRSVLFSSVCKFCLRLGFYVIMTSQRELFPRLTADMRRFKKLPQIYRDPSDLSGRAANERMDSGSVAARESELDLWEDTTTPVTPATSPESQPTESLPSEGQSEDSHGLFYLSPLFPLLNSEVMTARRQIQSSVEQAMGHCRRDNLWRRLFHGEHLALDKLKLSRLAFSELEELLNAVQSRSVAEIDPQLVCKHTTYFMLSSTYENIFYVHISVSFLLTVLWQPTPQ